MGFVICYIDISSRIATVMCISLVNCAKMIHNDHVRVAGGRAEWTWFSMRVVMRLEYYLIEKQL
jgi:hypothetical protein